MTRRVVVTGLGLVTPVGNSVETTWAALMKAAVASDYIKKFDTEKFSVQFACEVKDFDPLNFIEKKEARKMGAFIHYAIAASPGSDGRQRIPAKEITDEIAENVGTYISSGIGDFWAIEREHSKLLNDGPTASRRSLFLRRSLISPPVRFRFVTTRRVRIRRPRPPVPPARMRSATASRSFSAATPT